MPSADKHALSADSTLTAAAEPEAETWSPGLGHAPGNDPGEPETWDIFRVHCPECHRPIALVGDEERLPQHAVLPTAWHPFSAALCPGSGLSADDLEEIDPEPGADPGSALVALLTLPAQLDWRTQPFSHAGAPVPPAAGNRVPPMRKAPAAGLARR